jgi:peptidoglycan/LPS O-acetylase OafA/YrhL
LKYRTEIDGLRAVAVLPVVAFHIAPMRFTGGFTGVDVFFVISGFLISTLIFEQQDQGRFRFIDFYLKRMRRLLPALILVLFTSLLIGSIILFPQELLRQTKHTLGSLAYIQNFILASEAGYFDIGARLKPLLHLWSLAIEEQFYLFWPLVLWMGHKLRINLFFLILLLTSLSLFHCYELTQTRPTQAFFWPTSRAWELLSGGLLAWIIHYKNKEIAQLVSKFNTHRFFRPAVIANITSLVGLSILLYGYLHIHKGDGFSINLVYLPVIGSLLVLASGSRSIINRVVLMNPFAVKIGLISYPLYLWHWPLITYNHILAGESPSVLSRLLIVGISLILAWMTYEFLEKPIRAKGRRKPRYIALATMLSLIFALSAVVIYKQGKIGVLGSKQDIIDTAAASPKRIECTTSIARLSTYDGACKYFNDNVRVAVIGNSHASELSYALARQLSEKNIGIWQYSIAVCFYEFLPRTDSKICKDWHDDAAREIIANPEIEYVVLSYKSDVYIASPKRRLAFLDYVNSLVKHNKQIILVMQTPTLPRHVQFYIRLLGNASTDRASRSLQEWDQLYAGAQELKKEFKQRFPNNGYIIDPVNTFCDDHNCYPIIDRKALYYDTNHMSLYGAELLSNKILEIIDTDKNFAD